MQISMQDIHRLSTKHTLRDYFGGDDMWTKNASNGKTYEESIKETLLDDLKDRREGATGDESVNTHGRPRVLHHFLSMLTRTAERRPFEPCSERKMIS